MDPDRWRRIRQIFDRVTALPAEDRDTYLLRQCAGDDELLRSVTELLESAPPEPFLEPIPEEGQLVESIERECDYQILRRLGSGGMGVVYLAKEKTPTARLVAIKAIQAGFNTRQITARFMAEQRVLAKMDHPGIARIYNAGATQQGTPFFVMEYVEGTSIANYCDARAVDLRGRLQLLADVCSAIEHAHSKGVVHRDLKPSNILVRDGESGPVPKVIDFGVSRALDDRDSGSGKTTQVGTVVGTVDYMSPEQANPFVREIGPVADVYSLGVVLFDLICDSLPFGSSDSASNVSHPSEERRLPTPSERLAQLSSTDLQRLAERRGTSPAALRRHVDSDLDAIVVKSLQFDPTNRYATAGGMREDIRRFLKGTPVSAPRTTGVGAWSRRSIKRFRSTPWPAVAVAVVVMLAIVLVANAIKPRNSSGDVPGRLVGTNLELLDKDGALVNSIPFPTIDADFYESVYQKRPMLEAMLLHEDILGDGAKEYLFTFMPDNLSAEKGRLYCYSADGEELWSFGFDKTITWIDEGEKRVFDRFSSQLPVLLSGVDGERYLVAETGDKKSFASWVISLEASSGRPVGEYIHPGRIVGMELVDTDGDLKDELVLSGANNPGRNACNIPALAILPLPLPPVDSADPSDPFGFERSPALHYWLFSVPDVIAKDDTIPKVYNVEIGGGRVELHVGGSRDIKEPPDVIYTLHLDEELVSASDTSYFRRRHSQLSRAGELDHELSDHERSTLKQVVHLSGRNGNANDPETKQRLVTEFNRPFWGECLGDLP